MALAETAGAAWVESDATPAVVTSATVTPVAGGLIVACAALGNGATATNTATNITTTLGGTVGAFTLRRGQLATGGGIGGAWVWVADAGSAPAAGTVTVTITGTARDVGVTVRRFQGAALAAAQTGVTASASNVSTGSLAITPGTTGSQIVGAAGMGSSTTAFVASTSTTIYGQTGGGQGDQLAAFEAAALSAAGVPPSPNLGFTSAVSGFSIVLVEILPGEGAADTTPVWAASQGTLGGGAGSWVNPGNATGAADASFATWTAP